MVDTGQGTVLNGTLPVTAFMELNENDQYDYES